MAFLDTLLAKLYRSRFDPFSPSTNPPDLLILIVSLSDLHILPYILFENAKKAGIRVPASFMTGVSFSEMFNTYHIGRSSFSNSDNDNNEDASYTTSSTKESDMQQLLGSMCFVCQGFTFVLALSVVMMSSSSLV